LVAEVSRPEDAEPSDTSEAQSAVPSNLVSPQNPIDTSDFTTLVSRST
jgi:hypothetical protein